MSAILSAKNWHPLCSLPCASHILTLLYDTEVTKAVFPNKLDGEAAATHASADNENFCIERHSGREGDMR